MAEEEQGGSTGLVYMLVAWCEGKYGGGLHPYELEPLIYLYGEPWKVAVHTRSAVGWVQ